MSQQFARTSELLAVSAKILNNDVEEAYGHRKDPAGIELLKALTVDPAKDAAPVIQLAYTTFYLGCGRSMKDSIQIFGEGTRVAGRKPSNVAEIRLKPNRQYIDGVEVGYYRLNIPHALESKWKEIQGYTQVFGNITVLYIFGDRRQIKINVSTEAEGHRCMNLLLKLVDPAVLNGSSEEHSYIGRRAKNRKKHKLEGLTGTANQIKQKFPDRTSLIYQL
jgi:hypothetical protein